MVPYYPPALALGDVSTGVHAYAAVATALLHRERTGEGQHLDISLLDSYFHYHDMAVSMVSASHGEARVRRVGNQIGALSPAGIFTTKTGSLWIFAFQDNHWAKLCEVMDGKISCAQRTASTILREWLIGRQSTRPSIRGWRHCRARMRRLRFYARRQFRTPRC